MHYVSHLEGAIDGHILPAGQLHGMHAGRPIWVRYDLKRLRETVSPNTWSDRKTPTGMWKYRELLPLPPEQEAVTLGENLTPLLHLQRVATQWNLPRLFIKDESTLPTGSFKSRGMSMAISMAKWLGVKHIALPTAGNAGGAAAAYAARAGIQCTIFMPEDTPIVNQFEATLYGAELYLVNGLIHDCGKLVREGAATHGWFDFSTLKEPYRLEGKKTMGLELAEQFDYELPDVILYPTGGGTGLIGMWKAFQELKELGWLKSNRLPRLYSCQSDGCAPIVTAFDKGERFATEFKPAQTIASGLRVPVAVGDFMMLDAIRQSGGKAIAGSETRVNHWMQQVASQEGISLCPETAICFEVLQKLVASGEVTSEMKVVIFNTGAATKYLEAMPVQAKPIDKDNFR